MKLLLSLTDGRTDGADGECAKEVGARGWVPPKIHTRGSVVMFVVLNVVVKIDTLDAIMLVFLSGPLMPMYF
jgi:hypothetical protein